MRLRDRLSSLSSPVALARNDAPFPPFAADETKRAERISQLRALIAGVEQRAPRLPAPPARVRDLGAGLDPRLGEAVATEDGLLCRKRRWLEPEHCHGRVRVNAALQADSGVLARLALQPELAQLDVSRLLVIDTETTGLAGGTGTVPFLVGLAWFEDGALTLEQLLLPNFGAERPLLRQLAERLAAASCIVTYNGKSFDWPLLRTRFILNRVASPELPPHVDLLHCARRVFKPRLPTLRLTELERSVLAFHRDDDIDGAEIPGRYLGYLRTGEPDLLLPVLEHNQHDIVALPAVLWRLCAHFEQPRASDDARDQLAYARLALRAGDHERARVFGQAAAEAAQTAAVRCDAFSVCAQVARQLGDPDEAATLWQRALQAAPEALVSARLHLVLARLYERKLKDLQRAHAHAGFTAPAEGELARDRRLSRLSRRLQRMAG